MFADYCSDGLDLISHILSFLKLAAYKAHPENKPYLVVTVITNLLQDLRLNLVQSIQSFNTLFNWGKELLSVEWRIF